MRIIKQLDFTFHGQNIPNYAQNILLNLLNFQLSYPCSIL